MDVERQVAFRLRLMLLQQEAEFMSPAGICTETVRIEQLFDVKLRHALCDHSERAVSVHLWQADSRN